MPPGEGPRTPHRRPIALLLTETAHASHPTPSYFPPDPSDSKEHKTANPVERHAISGSTNDSAPSRGGDRLDLLP